MGIPHHEQSLPWRLRALALRLYALCPLPSRVLIANLHRVYVVELPGSRRCICCDLTAGRWAPWAQRSDRQAKPVCA